MKKLTITLSMLLAFVFVISCSEDTTEIINDSQDFSYDINEEKTNIGTYKGVFTTLDSEYRGIVEINIEDFSLHYDSKSAHRATINLQNGDVVFASSKEFVNKDENTNNIHFSSPKISFDFSVNGDASNPKITNVVLNNKEADIILAKHTKRAPITPITGTYSCFGCNLIAGNTFNLMFTDDASGDTTTTTQVVFNGVSYNGIGVQNTCNPDGTTTTCDIVSGDGIDKEGFLVNGVPVTWSGRHTFNNEVTGANDCSEVLGFWKRGNIFGGFKQDPGTGCPPATVNLHQETFTSFTGAGFSPSPTAGQLDSDVIIVNGFSDGSLNYGDTGTSGDFARGQNDGGVGTGGIYAFEVMPGEFALGIQSGGSDFTPGYIEVKATNTTGNNLGAFDISYDIYVYNDQNRANSINFSYSTDGINYIEVTDLDFISPLNEDGSPTWVKTTKTATFYGEVPDGGNLYLRFSGDDVSGGGSRDEFAINNLSVTQAE